MPFNDTGNNTEKETFLFNNSLMEIAMNKKFLELQ